jgi:acyl carrier protein
VASVAAGRAINDDTPLIEERILDSLSLLSVVAQLERDFTIRIGDSDILPTHFSSVRAIREFLRTKGC